MFFVCLFSLVTMLFTVIYGGKKKLIKGDGADYTSLMTQGTVCNLN